MCQESDVKDCGYIRKRLQDWKEGKKKMDWYILNWYGDQLRNELACKPKSQNLKPELTVGDKSKPNQTHHLTY